jgi:hypothetical protein
MVLSPRTVVRQLMAEGRTQVQVKATYMGMRNSYLAVFSDVIVAGKASLTHVHVHVQYIHPQELEQLEPGDRVLMTADPDEYVSKKHPEGGVSFRSVHMVKRLNNTRRKLVKY